jgi:hypothetical protein
MRPVLFSVAAVPLLAHSAFGWGCDGHQIVALIARAHLTPAASATVGRILEASPVHPGHYRFCQDEPMDLMAVAAPWADDMKKTDGTFDWHQIDIPVTVESGDYKRWCPPIGPFIEGKDRTGCIVNAIEYELNLTRDSAQPADVRAKALRYLIHLMGDLSQPLHVSDNRDQGGNCTSLKATFLEMPSNLHAIWDYELITQELRRNRMSETQLASNIDREFGLHWPEWGQAKTDIVGWTWEAHRLAAAVTYGDLKPPIPLEAPGNGHTDRATCDAGRAKVAALKITVSEPYVEKTLPVIHQQLAKAGYRLAGLLNVTFR